MLTNHDGASEQASQEAPRIHTLRFKPLDGFKIHTTASTTPAGRHLRIRSDESGTLHVAKKKYKVKDAPNIMSQTRSSDQASDPLLCRIPTCTDNLPEGVDLSVLDDLGSTRRPQTASDTPLLNWMAEDREDFLRELIRLEGRGGTTVCTSCKMELGTYRCDDCLTFDIWCRKCILLRHQTQPVHLVKEWTGEFWVRRPLNKLGLVIQLGHSIGDPCYVPKVPYSDDFVIIDTSGIHSVTLRFCGCESADSPVQQLMRHRLFPASTQQPRTAATFSLLQHFHLLSLESKISAYHYYTSLTRHTNNTGLSPPKDRYEQFRQIVREWRHLKLLKRSGRGHDPAGVERTQEGQCAVLCPACPQPGKNLPDDWDKAPEDKKWLYTLFIAIDANFRLKRRLVSNDEVDPSLGRGWAYFVEELSYKLYLREHANVRQEKSMCVNHSAVNNAETKSSKGLAATGLGTICCARHEIKLPCGVGDLQDGERYVNMDYLFFSALKGTGIKALNVSYDIACQWILHLWERMKTLPSPMHFDHENKIVNAFVPKFHLPAHIVQCQWKYSFNFIKGAGRTDGEAPERGWSTLNAVASSTKEMGPGHRRDTLDDIIGDNNWKKVVGLGEAILRKIIEAVPERNDHQDDLHEFEKSLILQYGTQLSKWKADYEAWEKDMSLPNPFEVKPNSITQASVRLQLARDEAHSLGIEGPPVHADITPTVLISMGIDLEEQQRRLCVDVAKLGSHATDQQKAKLLQWNNSLTRRIEAWASVQTLYIPCITALRAKTPPELETVRKPEAFPLWLPSMLRRRVPCDIKLEEIEWKLRIGQASDALEELRQGLRSRSYMLRFKDRFLRGQGANTRARNSLKSVDGKIDASTTKYHAAHRALLALSPLLSKTGWQETFRFLRDEDIRSMTEGTEDRSSEGRKRLSWIWIMRTYKDGERDDEQELRDAIRIEWCKMRARADRWAEEVEYLVEEQRRVLQFFHWHSTWWLERQALVKTDDLALKEGLKAYALRQATLREDLRAHFEHIWRDTERYIEIGGGLNTDDS